MKKHMIIWFGPLSILIVIVLATSRFASADHDHEEQRHHERHGKRHENHGIFQSAYMNNPTYKNNCGSCHYAYPPDLLPSGSWDKIIAGLQDHYEETVEIDQNTLKVISEYLKTNAAESSSMKHSKRIMESLGSQTPTRITEIPYIQKEHREIKPEVFESSSIGSRSNCTKCHTSAEKGIFKDDYVTIPK